MGRGASWRYRIRGADGRELEAALRVEHALRTDDRYEVHYRAETGGLSRSYLQACSAERADEPWSLATAADVRSVGDGWQVRARYDGDETQRATFEGPGFDVGRGTVAEMRFESARQIRVVGMETVEVPAGRFEALHIAFEERRTDVPSDDVKLGDQWLAEGIGLVRATVRLRDGTLVAEQDLVEVVGPS